jgi:hypothetical protein
MLIDRKAEMGCEGEGPARKRLKTAVDNATQISSASILEVNRQGPLTQISTEPYFVDDHDDDQAEIPTDTIAALNLLKSEFPKLIGVCLQCSTMWCGKPFEL